MTHDPPGKAGFPSFGGLQGMGDLRPRQGRAAVGWVQVWCLGLKHLSMGLPPDALTRGSPAPLGRLLWPTGGGVQALEAQAALCTVVILPVRSEAERGALSVGLWRGGGPSRARG